MHTVSQRRTIPAPLDDVWAVLDDFGGVENYNPNVEHAHITNGIETGEGATRQCEFYDGSSVQERIVSYDPETGYDVDFVDVGSIPVKEMHASIRVRELDDETTEVELTSRFVPKFGPLGWVVAKLLMKPKLEQTLADVLEGLEAHIETGTRIDEESRLLDAQTRTTT
ncbi:MULTISPECIES: SRPBCC family protein [Haloferax]|uniref:SRPBCC family protein n=1 Tax=Haloferax marinum TaxID=2666143 RepID=A0A6A8G7Q4_9EURY|nr:MULTISPECIES: SRPBCC family protein [Haloferax]KAB1197274.1 SRPBCC family protein [Haloferax sp. CBA1150]MRW96313.1 hypothetical protein [Haloferax marinum]